MKKFISNKIVLTALGIILFFLIWFLISVIIDETTLIFPGPFKTILESVKLLGTSYLYKCLANSFLRLLIGFLISFVLAGIFGTLSGIFNKLYIILKPSITALKAIPTATLLFLFLVLSGAKNAPIYVVVILAFPILYEAFVGGIANMDKTIEDSIKLEGSNTLKSILKVRVPLAMPYILVGLSSSFALAFKVEIMAEVLSGNTADGLGCAIYAAKVNDPSNMTPIFAWSLIAIVLMLLIDLLNYELKKRIDRKYGIN